MSETPVDPPVDPPVEPEPEPRAGDHINTALVAFTGCIGEAVPDICSYGLTIGDSYVPFLPDEGDCEDDDDEMCSQVWVRVVSVDIASTEGFNGGDCASVMRLELEVGIIRCIEIPEGGEAPTASDVLAAAIQANHDMNAIYCAAMGCEVWDAINAGQWVPEGPQGGQYAGVWTFTVEI